MKTILVVFGTRPEAIKMCPLVQELKRRPATFDTIVCVTGQHREMLASVLDTFDMTPDFDLDIMKEGQTLYDITANVLLKMNDILAKTKPDIVLVHGDTSTSFAAALAAFYQQIPVGHVEAGLRTNNLLSPYPEEFNRQAVDIIARYYFAPTQTAKHNLLKEGKQEERIFVTGNTGIDALKTTVQDTYTNPLLDWVGTDKLILVTAHRRENLGNAMHHMFRAIRRVLEEHPGYKMVYPVHLNPLVRDAAKAELAGCPSIKLVDPLNVFDFHNILARSYIVLTDSGGIQEEAPGLGKPVLVMRDTTERPEGVEAGTLMLTGTDEEKIYRSFIDLLDYSDLYRTMSKATNPYGDGHASERIADILERA